MEILGLSRRHNRPQKLRSTKHNTRRPCIVEFHKKGEEVAHLSHDCLSPSNVGDMPLDAPGCLLEISSPFHSLDLCALPNLFIRQCSHTRQLFTFEEFQTGAAAGAHES